MAAPGGSLNSLRFGDTVLLYAKDVKSYVFSELTRCVCLMHAWSGLKGPSFWHGVCFNYLSFLFSFWSSEHNCVALRGVESEHDPNLPNIHCECLCMYATFTLRILLVYTGFCNIFAALAESVQGACTFRPTIKKIKKWILADFIILWPTRKWKSNSRRIFPFSFFLFSEENKKWIQTDTLLFPFFLKEAKKEF